MGIKKGDLTRYLKTKLLPLFGDGWFMHQGVQVLRLNGLLLQGVVLDRSRYLNEFAPRFFVMVLAEPGDDYFIHLTLGNHLQDHDDSPYRLPLPLDRSYYTEKVIRTRWRDVPFNDEGQPDPVWLYETIRDQTLPRIDQPLTLDAVHSYLKQNKRDSDHFAVLWSRGIVEGLRGDIKEAQKWLGKAEKVLAENERSWRSQPVPESLIKDLVGLRQMIAAATDADGFRRYCEEVAVRNIQKLKLPLTPEATPPET